MTLYVLKNNERICPLNDSSLLDILADLKCVLTSTTSGEYAKPSDVFDPRDDDIKSMFKGTDLITFPAAQFRKKAILDKLRAIGMKIAHNLNANQIGQLAQHVDKKCRESTSTSKQTPGGLEQQGRALTDFLEKRPELFNGLVTQTTIR